jgi:hypothetical protein
VRLRDGASKDSVLQGHNAQIAVDARTQIIVAANLTQQTNDSQQLLPRINQVRWNMGRHPERVSADAGYQTRYLRKTPGRDDSSFWRGAGG